jgi:hypothetical protein
LLDALRSRYRARRHRRQAQGMTLDRSSALPMLK